MLALMPSMHDAPRSTDKTVYMTDHAEGTALYLSATQMHTEIKMSLESQKECINRLFPDASSLLAVK